MEAKLFSKAGIFIAMEGMLFNCLVAVVDGQDMKAIFLSIGVSMALIGSIMILVYLTRPKIK